MNSSFRCCKGIRKQCVNRDRQQTQLNLQLLESRVLLAADLIAHWNAEDLTHSIADGGEIAEWTDSVSGIRATAVGSPTLIRGIYDGQSTVRLEPNGGTDAFVVDADVSPMNGIEEFSIVVVFSTESKILRGGPINWYLNTGLVDASDFFGAEQDWGFVLTSSGQLGGGIGKPVVTQYSAVDGLGDGEIHVGVFTQSAETISVYVNGNDPDVRTDGPTTLRGNLSMTFGTVLTTENPFQGDISEIRFYDDALTTDEVKQLSDELLSRYISFPPSVNDDVYEFPEDTVLSVSAEQGLLANDTDKDSQPLSARLETGTTSGTVVIGEDGSFVYTPLNHFFGVDSFTYIADDGVSTTVGTVELAITAQDDPVVAIPESYLVPSNSVVQIDAAAGVLANDLDLDGSELTASLEVDVTDGALILFEEGSFTYDSQGFSGETSFRYQVTDESGSHSSATVKLTVDAPPMAVGEDYIMSEDQVLVVDVASGVLGNDSDSDGDTLTAAISRLPSGGMLSLNKDGSFVYTPLEKFYGVDMFSYVANDGDQISAPAIVEVTVSPVIDSPQAVQDYYRASVAAPIAIGHEEGVLRNDIDVEGGGGGLAAVLATGPTNGTVQLDADGSFRYTPNPTFMGRDSFEYLAANDTGKSDLARVEILVGPAIPERTSTDSIITINEIMYQPSDGDHELQWVEITNQLAVDVDISEWSVRGDIQYEFPLGTIIPGDGYLVIGASLSALANIGIDGGMGPFSGSLDAFRGTVELFNNSDRIMDRIAYSDRDAWPSGPDGSGATLTKINRHSRSEPFENWTTSRQIGGTPGAHNFPATVLPTRTEVLNFGSDWSYDTSATDLGDSWRSPGFDDTTWNSSVAPFRVESEIKVLPPYDQLILQSEPLAYYRLNEDSSKIFDFSVNGNNGTSRNAFMGEEGLISGQDTAVRTHGSRNIEVPGFEKFPEGSTGYSVEYWILVRRAPSRPHHNIVGDGEDDNDFYLMNYLSNLRIRPHFNGVGTVSFDSVQELEVGVPYHVVTTWDQTSGMGSIYINGELDSSMFVGTGDPINTDNMLFIGDDDRERGSDFTLDEVAIYNKPLEAEQIFDHYTAGSDLPGTDIEIDAPTQYFRTTFEFDRMLDDMTVSTTLTLSPNIRDGAVYYLNGQELLRKNLAGGSIAFGTPATVVIEDPENTAEVFSMPADLLQPGTNVLAVEVHRAEGQTDTYFDLRLDVIQTPSNETAQDTLLLSELSSGATDDSWVEIINVSDQTVSLEGIVVSLKSEVERKVVLPAASLESNEHFLVNLVDAQANDNVFLYSADRLELLDARVVTNRPQARSNDLDRRWLYPNLSTPDGPNVFDIEDAIVINEIMYHHRTTPATLLVPPQENVEEWIELYNRSENPVDVSGWRLASAVDFTFRANTVIGPGDFLVVARDPGDLRELHPDLGRRIVIGTYDRGLSNLGERIQLLDANLNPVDEVHYLDGGRWDGFADGGGASLELRDPYADNRIPEAWGASNEARDSQWLKVIYRGLGTPSVNNDPRLYNEFLFGLLDDGELLIDDISVIENPGTDEARQLVQNVSFDVDPVGSTPAYWRIIGTQQGTVVVDPDNEANQVLHLVASGPTEHMHNQASTTLKFEDELIRLSNNSEYEISFRAKWLAGSNQLHTRLYFNRLARTHLLPVSAQSGTPGRPNSVLEGNIGPTFANLHHSPVVPFAGQPVTVLVDAVDPQGIAEMTLFYSINEGPFRQTAMVDNGHQSYSALLPGQSEGSTIQFYVQGRDAAGARSMFPESGFESRALIPVNDGLADLGLTHNVRIVMTKSDTDNLHDVPNVMSNARFGSTVIYNENQIFYDVGTRLKGSQRGRARDVRVGFNLAFDPEDLFLGVHRTIGIDRSGAGDQFSQKEVLINHAIPRAGDIPGSYVDLIRVVAPLEVHTGSAILQLARLNDIFLDSQYENGSRGTSFEYELIYSPNGTVDGNKDSPKVPNPDSVVGVSMISQGDDVENYRWHWLIKKNRDEDDYRQLARMLKALGQSEGAANFLEQVEEHVDIDQWLRAFAIQILFGISDSYSSGSQHNAQFYVRPSDNKVLHLPHDMDFTGSQGISSTLESNNELRKFVNFPQYHRAYYGHIHDIITTTFNIDYMDSWITHYSSFLPNEDLGRKFRRYIELRAESALGRVDSEIPMVDFAITSPDEVDMGPQLAAKIQGTAWVNVREIRLAGSTQPLNLEWPTSYEWIAGIPVKLGTETLNLEAYDFQGNMIGTDSITISSQATNPVGASLRVTELNYNPGTADPSLGESDTDNDNFEFVELTNVGPETINLDGVRLVQVELGGDDEGIRFTFDQQFVVSGETVLIVRDRSAFVSRYGTGRPLALGHQETGVHGQYGGRLANGGEVLTVVDSNGGTIQSFRYDDSWYPGTEGEGSTLEIVDATNPDLVSWSNAESWRPSLNAGGSPGERGTRGDLNDDGTVDVGDIDAIQQKIRNPTDDVIFDVNGDGNENQADVEELVVDLIGTRLGDVNLDGAVAIDDFVILATHFGTEDASWIKGDFNSNGLIDFDDFTLLANNFGFEKAPTVARPVQPAPDIAATEFDASDALFASLSEDDLRRLQ